MTSQLIKPPLFGLVMAGGSGSRLGLDKTSLTFHGMPQRKFLQDLLGRYCKQVYLSVKKLPEDLNPHRQYLIDKGDNIGPIAGVISALEHHPQAAWVIVAVDLVLFDQKALRQLIDHRDVGADVTAMQHPDKSYPEPFAAIWEPSSLHIVQEQIGKNNYSPINIMKHGKIRQVAPDNPDWLLNVNTREDLALAVAKLQSRS